jgi:putative ABC transport system substrate-binding protein
MRRREFITLLGGAAAWPLATRAQQLKRIGVLMNGAANGAGQAIVAAFAERLRKLGWIEGQTIHSELRWNDGSAAVARALRPSWSPWGSMRSCHPQPST